MAVDDISNNIWLVVWNMAFIFPYIGNSNPNCLSFFSKGWLNHQPDMYKYLCLCYSPAAIQGMFLRKGWGWGHTVIHAICT